MADHVPGDVTPVAVEPGVWAFRKEASGNVYQSFAVLGDTVSLVVDTLFCPADMAPVIALLARQNLGRPVWVLNTHADWDHAWGNSAFAGAPLLGHRLCRQRLIMEGPAMLAQFQQQFSGYADVRIVPPSLCLDGGPVTLDLGGLTAVFLPAPGHTADSIAVWLPERRLLIAADAAEEPLPLVDPSGSVAAFLASLTALQDLQPRQILTSHGPPSGPELLAANRTYLINLQAEVGRLLASGKTAAAIDLPFGDLPPFYQEAHRANIRATIHELKATGHAPTQGN